MGYDLFLFISWLAGDRRSFAMSFIQADRMPLGRGKCSVAKTHKILELDVKKEEGG